MTAFDQFDPFERRISSAIDEIAMARQPDYLDDVFRLTARSSQRPRWTFPERWTSVNRRTFQAAAALVVVVVAVGTFYAFGSRGPATTVPTPSPSPTAPAGPSPTAEAVVPLPEALWGDWIAEVDRIPGITLRAAMIQLSIDSQQGNRVWLQVLPDDPQLLSSAPLAAPNFELRVRSNGVQYQCPLDSEGRYSWSRSADGLFLSLEAIDDACVERATVFARTWVRSLGAVNDGGAGVAFGVSPMTRVTLPRGQRLAASSGDLWQEIKTYGDVEPFQAFVVVGNPGAFDAPCSTEDTAKTSFAQTTDAWVAYVEGLPGATVTTAATQVGGRPAIRMDVSIDDAVDCPSGAIEAFRPGNPADTTTWAFSPGELERMYIVQMDASTTFLLWYQGNSDTEQAVIESISFIDALPTP